MQQTNEIRRNTNGSIDIEHYAKIGRSLHGHAVRSAFRQGFGTPGRILSRVFAVAKSYRAPARHAVDIAPAE